jgi:hypothetical protein
MGMSAGTPMSIVPAAPGDATMAIMTPTPLVPNDDGHRLRGVAA